MTTDERGPGDRPALSRCTTLDAAEFADRFWAREPLFTPSGQLGQDFSDLFSQEAADELVAERALRTPFARMAKEGEVLPPARFTGAGGFGAEVADQLDADRVLAEFATGSTLVLQGLHRTWPPIAQFSRRLAVELGHPCQVNAYITPASSRGFDPHYDVHDVFVLQIAGEKHWRIHAPVHPDPLRDQPWGDHREAVAARALEEPVIDEVFRPGDALYLPRGWIHSAEALGAVSVHLTIGVAAYTRQEIVQQAIARAADAVPALRSSLPLGFDPDDAEALRPLVQATLDALRDALDDPRTREDVTTEVARSLARRRARDSPPEPVHPLATIAAADALGPRSLVIARTGLHPRVVTDDTSVSIRLRETTVTLPVAADAAVRRLLDGDPVRVGDLPGLDAESALVVARRLLREAVIVAAP